MSLNRDPCPDEKHHLLPPPRPLPHRPLVVSLHHPCRPLVASAPRPSAPQTPSIGHFLTEQQDPNLDRLHRAFLALFVSHHEARSSPHRYRPLPRVLVPPIRRHRHR